MSDTPDTGFGGGSLVPGAPSMPVLPGSTDPDEFATRVRAWYLEAVGHKLWKDWMEESEEDMLFYIGGKGQWSYKGSFQDWDRLEQKRRAHFSVNHIQSVCDVMSGYERANRSDIRAMPQGDQDNEGAQKMSWLLKYAQEQTGTADVITEMFEEGNIRGMDVCEVGVDYTGDRPVNGELVINRLVPGYGQGREIIWDPFWTKYDFSDARYMLRFRWAFLLDLIAEYPEHEQELREAVDALHRIFRENQHRTSARTGHDNYGYVRRHPVERLDDENQFYYDADQRLLIIEAWYHVYYVKYAVFDKTTGKVVEVASAQAAAELKASDPTNLRIHRTESKRVRMATVIPATYVTIEEDKNPYPNDDTNYPFVPYIAKRKGDVIYGVVRNLKDPQRIENKRWSQLADMIAKWAMIRPLIPKGTLAGPDKLAFNDAGNDAPIEYDPVKGAPTWMTAPVSQIVGVIDLLAKEMKVSIREISGINTDLLGQKQSGDAGSSGVAIARRQQQGQIIATIHFDNLKKTRKLIGQRLARRIQQVYTTEDTMRLTNDIGTPVTVRINPAAAKDLKGDDYKRWVQAESGAGKPEILRDVTSLKYEVVISEAPTTPTARAAALLSTLEIADKVPQAAILLLYQIMELADLPNREEILPLVRKLQMSLMPAVFGPGGPGQGSPAPVNPATQPEVPGSPPGQPPKPGPQPGAPPGGQAQAA